jgi:drug/metabolite transporter (DMT)-like permease
VNEGIGFALAAAFVFGGYLVAIKRYFGHYPSTLYVALVNATALPWAVAIGVVTVPQSGYLPDSLSAVGVAVLLGTGVLTAAALLAFFRAIRVGEVSYVAPLSKLVPVFVLPLEVLVLSQRLTPLQVGGVVVATGAVYVANYRADGLLTPFRRAATSRAAQFALLSAATFGVVDLGKRVIVQELAIPPATFVPVSMLTVLVVVLPFAVGERDAVGVRADLPALVGMGLLAAVGQHLTAIAFETLPASVVSPLVNTQAVVAVVLGSLLLGESHFRTRLVAAALAVGGITLITLG